MNHVSQKALDVSLAACMYVPVQELLLTYYGLCVFVEQCTIRHNSILARKSCTTNSRIMHAVSDQLAKDGCHSPSTIEECGGDAQIMMLPAMCVTRAFLSLRINEVRLGSVVGKDEFGNQYFENKQYFYGEYC